MAFDILLGRAAREVNVGAPASIATHPEYMRVAEIFFSQSSVSSTFSDGTALEEVRRRLQEGRVRVEDFPPMRIVFDQGRWTTLDNRRLRVFKDAGMGLACVVRCDCEDPAILREFVAKKSIKSPEGGGVVRAELVGVPDRHDSGIYRFNKRVLNWTFEQIQQPFHAEELFPAYSTREKYYSSFESLIFEEARANLQAGLEQADAQGAYQFVLEQFKFANAPENPTDIRCAILSGSVRDIKPVDAFLFQSAQYPGVRLLSLANYSEQTSDEPRLSFKCVMDRGLERLYPSIFATGSKWNGIPIGSLISLQRMYSAVASGPSREDTSVERSIFAGVPEFQTVLDRQISPQERDLLDSLNESQRAVVTKCLDMDAGLQLIQGPPGTGKTTTVLKLLRALQQRGERILTCAPSNKAVQILAERFIQDYPDVPVILVGAGESLPRDSSLQRIFLGTWRARQEEFLKGISTALENMQQHSVVQNKGVVDRIERDFSRWINDMPQDPVFCHLVEQQAAFLKGIHDYNDCISAQPAIHNQYPPHVQKIPAADQASSLLSALLSIISSLGRVFQTRDVEMRTLLHARVLFMTLSIAGQQRLKDLLNPIDTLIVDEAGQAVEAETLIPLRTCPKKCVLVGDTQQLPATVVSRAAERLKFGRSMMERLEECRYPISMLTIQYRMHPEISSWPSRRFYQGQLRDHHSVSSLVMSRNARLYPFLSPYAFIDIQGQERPGPSGSSFVNHEEINGALSIIKHFKEVAGVANKIAVITFYKAQADAIKRRLNNSHKNVYVNTVDGFQGGESDIVIITCVRANWQQQIGFLKECKRLNVALTRAKYALIILGDAHTLERSDLAEMVQDARGRGLFYPGSELRRLSVQKPKPAGGKRPRDW